MNLTKEGIKYPLLNYVPALRTPKKSLYHIREKIFGFERSSSLLGLNTFDIIKGFILDPMHNVDMEIVRKVWFLEDTLFHLVLLISLMNE